MRKYLLSSSPVAFAVFSALPAQAQQASEPTRSAETSLPADSVGDIVVTALRSNTSSQKAGAAITAISGEALASRQIQDVRGIQTLVPAAKFSAANSSTRIFIRGVGSALDSYWIPETTAVNFNGTYLPRYATSGAFYDLDGVEVLPGPQGVLYGRSAGGGAVVINSRKPVLGKAQVSANLQYGNYDTVHVEGMGNLPIGDHLAVRVAGVYNRHDGYQPNGLQADDSFSVRGSILYKPTDDFSLLLWGTHLQQKGKTTAAVYLPLAQGLDPWFVPPTDPVTGRDNTRGAFDDYNYTTGGYKADLTLGAVQIDYVGSILHQTEQGLRKLIGNDQLIDDAQTQFVQNLHVSGTSGGFDWIFGADWFYAKSRFSLLLGPNRLGSIFPHIRQESLSGFAQGTWHVTENIRLVSGARYSHDILHLQGTNSRCFGPCVFPPVTFDHSWHHLDVKGGLEFDAAQGILLYANVQTGYAPGTVNTVIADGVTPPPGTSRDISPQTLLAFTGGAKATLVSGRLTLNLEGYHYKYDDLIIQSFVSSLNQQTLFNAPSATVWGLQVTSTLRPTPNDTLSGNVAYTHGRYGAFKATPIARDIASLQMVYTPDWTGTVSYNHRFDLANGARIDAGVSSYFSSSFWGTFDHSTATRQKSYTKTDASLTYHAADDRWSVGAWVKNIENEPVGTAVVTTGYAAPFAGTEFLEPPRTYGVSVGIKY